MNAQLTALREVFDCLDHAMHRGCLIATFRTYDLQKALDAIKEAHAGWLQLLNNLASAKRKLLQTGYPAPDNWLSYTPQEEIRLCIKEGDREYQYGMVPIESEGFFPVPRDGAPDIETVTQDNPLYEITVLTDVLRSLPTLVDEVSVAILRMDVQDGGKSDVVENGEPSVADREFEELNKFLAETEPIVNVQYQLLLWLRLRDGMIGIMAHTRRLLRNDPHLDKIHEDGKFARWLQFLKEALQGCIDCPPFDGGTDRLVAHDVKVEISVLLDAVGLSADRFLSDATSIMPKVDEVVNDLLDKSMASRQKPPKKRTPHNKGKKSALHQQIDLLAADGLSPGQIDQRVQGTNPQAISAYLYRERQKHGKKSDAR